MYAIRSYYVEVFGKSGLDAVNITLFQFPVEEVPAVFDLFGDCIETRSFEEHEVVRMGFLPALDKAHILKPCREPAGSYNFV